jgi:cell division protein FtsI/penicillin-binding protein 2
VLIENGGGGSEQAAPVAREILDYYLLSQRNEPEKYRLGERR